MCQFVDAPTRNNALLNLLITNNIDLIIRDNLGNRDHRVITFFHMKRRHEGSARTFIFKRANFSKWGPILHDIKLDQIQKI